MAKHTVDPALQELVDAVGQSAGAGVPVALTVRGAVLHGELISHEVYSAELVAANPLVAALQPGSGRFGKEHGKRSGEGPGHYLHLRGGRVHPELSGVGELWRVPLAAVDAWTLGTPHTESATPAQDDDDDTADRGPVARLLGG